MSGHSEADHHESPAPYTESSASATHPSQPSQLHPEHATPQPGSVIIPPSSSDRPRQSFSTFSIREPGTSGFDAQVGATPSSVAGTGTGNSPSTGPDQYRSDQSYTSRPNSQNGANGYDHNSNRPQTGPYDPYGTPNQYNGSAPSGPAASSGSVPPPSSDYPKRAEYTRSNSANSIAQSNVGGGLGLGAPTAGGGDPRFTRNGEPVIVAPRPNAQFRRNSSTPQGSPEKFAKELGDRNPQSSYSHPPRGPMSSGTAHEPVTRTEQLREIPTGPSGRPRTPAVPDNIPNRSTPNAPAYSTLPSQVQSTAPSNVPQPSTSEDTGSMTEAPKDDDMTELSSLAKLRQFKASIATKRSKQLHDVDSDALAEMAASFLASTNAVPPTPTTIEASHLGLTGVPIQPSAGTRPDVTAVASATAGASATASKTREQELKERLKSKAMKQEAGSSTPGPATDPAERKPLVDANGTPLKRDRLEEGEIADEVNKRARVELMPESAKTTGSGTMEEGPNTASTDSSDPKSAGKRKRAQEWMKTTTATQEAAAASPTSGLAPAPALDRAKEKPAAAVPVEERSLESRVERDPSRRERQASPGDRSRQKPLAKPRARSRSPVKPARTPGAIKGPKPATDRDFKPSLAERIGISYSKDQTNRHSDILDTPLGSRDRRNSVGRSARPSGPYDTPDVNRRSRSPQRSANSRPYDSDRNAPHERRSSITSRDRPDYRDRVRERELSPYSLARARSPNRGLPRDDRARYDSTEYGDRSRVERPRNNRASIGGLKDVGPSRGPAPAASSHQSTAVPAPAPAPARSAPVPAPAPAAAPAAAPLDSVSETLALLKAQIARLESQIPTGAAPSASAPAPAAPAPAPAPAPAKPSPPRYAPPPPAQTRQAAPAPYASDNRPGYAADARYDRERDRDRDRERDRRAAYERPLSPHRPLPPSGPPPSTYDRQRPIAPAPIPLHVHTHAAPPSRYSDPHAQGPPPQQQRYSDPRDARDSRDTRDLRDLRDTRDPRDTFRNILDPRSVHAPIDYARDDRDYRGPPRGYDAPPLSGPPPARSSYDPPPRDFAPAPLGAPYGGGGYRPSGPPRDLSPPPSSRPYSNYDSRGPAPLSPRPEYRERYDPASRPGPPPSRFGGGGASPVPSSYGGGAYSNNHDSRGPPADYDSRYPPGPPARRGGGFDNRAAGAGSARGGYSGRGRGGYEGSVGGRSDAGDRDRDRDVRDIRDRDYERERDPRDRDPRDRERDPRDLRDVRDRGDYQDDYRGGGGRGGYRGRGRGRGQ